MAITKEESQKIIDEMIEKQIERVPKEAHSSEKLMVPLTWMRDRFSTLKCLTEHPNWRADTIGKKHDCTVKKADQLLEEPVLQEIEFVEFDLKEWKAVAKQIRDYTKAVQEKTIKANYQEYMTTVNAILLAYMTIEVIISAKRPSKEWLDRENSTEVDHIMAVNGRGLRTVYGTNTQVQRRWIAQRKRHCWPILLNMKPLRLRLWEFLKRPSPRRIMGCHHRTDHCV